MHACAFFSFCRIFASSYACEEPEPRGSWRASWPLEIGCGVKFVSRGQRCAGWPSKTHAPERVPPSPEQNPISPTWTHTQLQQRMFAIIVFLIRRRYQANLVSALMVGVPRRPYVSTLRSSKLSNKAGRMNAIASGSLRATHPPGAASLACSASYKSEGRASKRATT